MSEGSSPAPRVVGLALISIGIGATFVAMNISLDQYGRWGARFFPLAGSLTLIVLGMLELRRAGGQLTSRQYWPAIAGLLVLSIAYVWAISIVGYIVATAFAAPLALWIFGVRSHLGLLAAGVICPGIYHLVFFEVLGVFPPLGRWFDLLDIIGGF